jgi:hypothetical protein
MESKFGVEIATMEEKTIVPGARERPEGCAKDESEPLHHKDITPCLKFK